MDVGDRSREKRRSETYRSGTMAGIEGSSFAALGSAPGRELVGEGGVGVDEEEAVLVLEVGEGSSWLSLGGEGGEDVGVVVGVAARST